MVRGRVQEFIQEILEDEVTEFLGGRAKSQRRATVEGGRRGYRNGYGKPRNLTLASGTVEVCRPRVRDVEERFESRVLPLFARRTKEAAELVVQLYLHGLAEGDFELALRGLLGDGAPLSKSTVRRLRERWVAEHAEWERRSLAGRELVYAWADGIYVKAGHAPLSSIRVPRGPPMTSACDARTVELKRFTTAILWSDRSLGGALVACRGVGEGDANPRCGANVCPSQGTKPRPTVPSLWGLATSVHCRSDTVARTAPG